MVASDLSIVGKYEKGYPDIMCWILDGKDVD